MNIKIRVITKNGTPFQFASALHVQSEPALFHLDPAEFYGQWINTFREGFHIELEITEPDEEFFRSHPSRTSRSRRNGQPFIVYPLRIPSPDRAEQILAAWCVAIVFKIETGQDYEAVFTGEYIDRTEFLRMMADKYGIRVSYRIIS